MKNRRLAILIAAGSVCALVPSCVRPQLVELPSRGPELSVIPKPLQMERLPGSFAITAAARIAVPANDPEFENIGHFLSDRLRTGFGIDLAVSMNPPVESQQLIILQRSDKTDLGPEGYELTVSPAAVSISAPETSGLYYGVQSLFQLLPPEAYGRGGMAAGPAVLPCVRIEDKPRFPWRGMLLDCSRHFFPKEFIKSFIDILALHKMNTFHWHLTDDQGWRLEIKKFPRLTEYGAWRVDREDKPWNSRPPQQPGEKAGYGGFYTRDDVREILAYAKQRRVAVVPEIEMPGHCLSALASYPQLSCSGGPFTVPPGGVWPIKDVFCAGNEETFDFLEDILGEVVDLFPDEYIHIGGDEVDKSTWKACPKCQARMKAEGLKNEEELQSWFIRRIERFLNSRGKKLLGWDEILEGGLAPNAAVMSWRGTEGGIAAARSGHTVIMTPTSHCYFDYYQGDPELEPPAIGGFLPLRKVYEFEPVPSELDGQQADFVIGAQANLWTEYIATPSHAHYMTVPRIAAMAEAGWTAKDNCDWNDFLGRMAGQFRRYDRMGINYARSVYAVKIAPALDARTNELRVSMKSESFRPVIRYTLDGTPPTAESEIYGKPLNLNQSTVIKAGVFASGKLQGPVSETRFRSHQALGLAPRLEFPFSPRYDGGGPIGLTDGLRAGKSTTDGRWQGFEKDDLAAVIDLGKRRPIRSITVGFLQNTGSWIFWPRTVEFAVSDNGRDWRVIGSVAAGDSDRVTDVMLKDIRADARGAKARYIRVMAPSIGLCPDWHPSAGGRAWLFADEIIVE